MSRIGSNVVNLRTARKRAARQRHDDAADAARKIHGLPLTAKREARALQEAEAKRHAGARRERGEDDVSGA